MQCYAYIIDLFYYYVFKHIVKSKSTLLLTWFITNTLYNSSGGKAGRRKVSQENKDPVFFLDIKTQNKRLVTPRQRQEIYALNR